MAKPKRCIARSRRIQFCGAGVRFIAQKLPKTALPAERQMQGVRIPPVRFVRRHGQTGHYRAQAWSAEALRHSEQRFRSLFENMLDGFAYCKILLDDNGRPVDFVYLEVNDAFETLTGLTNVVGKKVTEVIPGINESQPDLLERYGRVALTGEPDRFEIELKAIGIWFSISAYSPEKGYFIAGFR